MTRRHEDLLGKQEQDDADARGEHAYPGRRRPGGDAQDQALYRAPGSYAAGADGTQQVAPARRTPDEPA